MVRLFREADVDAFHAYRSDPELARYQGWSPMTHAEAMAFVKGMLCTTRLVPGAWIQLAIAHASTDALLGDLGLFLAEDQQSGEIGFTLCNAAQGQGHAARAVIEATALFLDVNEGIEIRGITDARNTPSIRVLERSGFVQVSVQDCVFKGESCTELVYSLRRNGANISDPGSGS